MLGSTEKKKNAQNSTSSSRNESSLLQFFAAGLPQWVAKTVHPADPFGLWGTLSYSGSAHGVYQRLTKPNEWSTFSLYLICAIGRINSIKVPSPRGTCSPLTSRHHILGPPPSTVVSTQVLPSLMLKGPWSQVLDHFSYLSILFLPN